MQRLFEQAVQLALEKLLGSRGSWAAAFDRSDPGAHQSKLQLLDAAYTETLALAADCERALRGMQARSCQCFGMGRGSCPGPPSWGEAEAPCSRGVQPALAGRLAKQRSGPGAVRLVPRRACLNPLKPSGSTNAPSRSRSTPLGRRHIHFGGPLARVSGRLPRPGAGLAGRGLQTRRAGLWALLRPHCLLLL